MGAAMETAPRPFLSLLGRPALRFGGLSTAFTPERRYQLLALLGLQSGRWVERQQVAHRLWPEHVASEARRNLRKVILQAREVPGTSGLEITDHALCWDIDCDVQAFEQAVLERRHAEVVALLTGQPLAGLEATGEGASADWLLDERARLLAAWQQSASELLRTQTQVGSNQTLAQRLLDVDPLDEAAVAIVIDDALASGNLTAAHRHFRVYAERLADELGIEPSHHLRERLHQAAGAPATVAARPQAAEPTAPAAGSAFIGRREELARIDTLLVHNGCRLLTLVGPGGVGKSRLAREVLTRCARHFPDGVGWVDLQDLDDLNALIHRLAQRLDIPISDASDPMDTVCQALRLKGGGKFLLVLDNAEHLEALGPWVDRLLAATSASLVVTSRHRLLCPDELDLPLAGLESPDEDSRDLEAAGAFDAVRLFDDRARQAQRGFALALHLEAVLDIVDAVGGMPLAIELAAGWVRLLPPGEIARDLRHSIALLEDDPVRTGGLARPEHASLRAVLDQAWGLLSPAQREAHSALSVFVGGFKHAAARSVAGASLAMLSSLVDRCMLAVDTQGRFAMHPVVATYVLERLGEDAAREQRLRVQHAQCLGRMLADLTTQARGNVQELVAGIAPELANVQAAWRWATSHRRADLCGEMVRALWAYFDHSGRLAEGIATLRPGLQLPAADTIGQRTRSRIRHGLSYLLYRQGELAQALAIAEAGDADGLDDADTEAWVGCLLMAGACRMDQGDPAAAMERFVRALQVARDRDDLHATGWALGYVAAGHGALGKPEDAIATYEQALSILRPLGDHYNVADILHNLGNLHRRQGDWQRARECMEQGLEHCRRHGVTSIGRVTPILLGAVLIQLGELAGARRHLERGLDECRRAGLAPWTWRAQRRLALIDLAEKATAQALARLRIVAEEAQRQSVRPELLETALMYGDVLHAEGQSTTAARIWRLVAADPGSYGISRADASQRLAALPSEVLSQVEGAGLSLEAALAPLLV
jgi:predicted ATPase/DNA-binding SARP family transcriptional activator/Tfp pilus assembly protein PilF